MHLTKPPAEEETAGGTTSLEKRPNKVWIGKAQTPIHRYVIWTTVGEEVVIRRKRDGARRAQQTQTTGPRRPPKICVQKGEVV